MPNVTKNISIKEYQDFVSQVYGLPNDRYFSLWDMLSNVERFSMRGLKGIRKEDNQKTKTNFIIALSWFTSMMNRFRIDLEEKVWQRFPYLCSYCVSCPCECKKEKIESRRKAKIDDLKRPKNFEGFQDMFSEIYPPDLRTSDHAGIHLAEEIGEFSEAILAYRGAHRDEDFKKMELESADVFSCFVGIFNSLGVSIAGELSSMFLDNCHVCHLAPCECKFIDITKFES